MPAYEETDTDAPSPHITSDLFCKNLGVYATEEVHIRRFILPFHLTSTLSLLYSLAAYNEDTSVPISAMDGMDEVTWHDDPEEHDNDDDEAENLHSIIEDVNNRVVDPEEIKTEIS